MKPLIRPLVGGKFRNLVVNLNGRVSSSFAKKIILEYYAARRAEVSEEQKEVIDYLEHNEFTLFPYEFIRNYRPDDVEVFTDEHRGLRYVLQDGKRLYFKRSYDEGRIRSDFSSLSLVQDKKSPHRYLSDDFTVAPDDIVADIGASEGDFSLSIVDRVRKIYIFESDPELQEALLATFEPWNEKVLIVGKYVTGKDGNGCVTLDNYFKEKEAPTLLKIDVEGAERDLLLGAERLLSGDNPMNVIIAAYHRYDDEIVLREILDRHGFKTGYSRGYMLSIWDDVLREPYLRRALIRAVKA